MWSITASYVSYKDIIITFCDSSGGEAFLLFMLLCLSETGQDEHWRETLSKQRAVTHWEGSGGPELSHVGQSAPTYQGHSSPVTMRN